MISGRPPTSLATTGRPTAKDLGTMRDQASQRPLRRTADVTGQQNNAVAAGDAQHAAVFVAALPAARRRVQYLEVDTVPLPAHSLPAGPGPGNRAAGRCQRMQPGQLTPQAGQAADVVQMVMAEHHLLGRPLAQRAQGRDQDPFIAVGAGRRPDVIPERVPRRAHQHRRALADIVHQQFQLTLRGCPARRPQQWQAEQQPRQATAGPARQQPPEHPQQRRRHRPARRLGQPPHRPRVQRQRLQGLPADLEQPGGGTPCPSSGAVVQDVKSGPQQRHRHHQQRPPRDDRQIDQRPQPRGATEQGHAQGQQAHARHSLRRQETAQATANALRRGARQAPQQPQHPAKAQPEPC
ncbi:hypothetical protein G6F68_010612 [Rhizopus microsporus]|nr:hypothetical protein G6F68_010612 [Rhizopus microsporus]